jgi:hypothetical protein
MNYLDLRKNYPVFTYKSFEWEYEENDLLIKWNLSTSNFEFHPQLRILNAKKQVSQTDKKVIDNFIFNLGVLESFSYWKAFCSPVIEIPAGYLDDDQLIFWTDLLLCGMGQYFYENNISYTEKNFIEIRSQSDDHSRFLKFGTNNLRSENRKTLIPVGGGKDSSLSLNLLTGNLSLKTLGAFVLNQNNNPSIKNIIKISGIDFIIETERVVDQKLLELNKNGFLNGHTPFSAYLAFLSVFAAVIFGFQDVVFSNERSSNEGNAKYLGFEFNHQYSKTIEFENKFRDYNRKYLSDINFFSFLRPLYDLQIMKLFSKCFRYLPAFISCNKTAREGRWCGKCSKCLSTYVCLFPFLDDETMLSIFGRDLLSDLDLVDLTHSMIGEDTVKPFECIGTREELKIAFYLSYKKAGNPDSLALLKYFVERILPEETNWEERSQKLLSEWDNNNNLGNEYKSILQKKIFAI